MVISKSSKQEYEKNIQRGKRIKEKAQEMNNDAETDTYAHSRIT